MFLSRTLVAKYFIHMLEKYQSESEYFVIIYFVNF